MIVPKPENQSTAWAPPLEPPALPAPPAPGAFRLRRGMAFTVNGARYVVSREMTRGRLVIKPVK
jgi:hypothetical protein